MGKYCLHCKDPVFGPDILSPQFCCNGCEMAYSVIESFNLTQYYQYCSTIYNSKPLKMDNSIKNQLSYIEDVVTHAAAPDEHKSFLLINGIQCGACVWLIENILRKQPEIISAQLNLSTRRLALEWQGEREDINKWVAAIEKLGYRALPFEADLQSIQQKQAEKNLLKCLLVAGFATAQVMMLATIIWICNIYGGMGEYTRIFLHLLIAVISIPAALYSGRSFFVAALEGIKKRRSNMNIPIAVAITATLIISIQETLLRHEYTYYDTAIGLIFVLLIGRYLDLKTRNKARESAHNMLLNQPRSVVLETENGLELVPISKAPIGAIAVIESGEKIPIDGIITQGSSMVDNSIITGETAPVSAGEGDTVYSGSINTGNTIKVKITQRGETTVLSEIIRLIENAEQGRAKYVQIADRASSCYTPIVFSLAILTFLLWKFFLGAKPTEAALYSVCVLIITCPCALGLAVPIVQIVSSLKLMKDGILIKTANALEKLAQIDIVIFDKTGTLTIGAPTLLNASDIDHSAMQLIASLAAYSKHPLCQAIKNFYGNQIILNLEVEEEKGMGLKAKYQGLELKLGNSTWCQISGSELRDGYTEMWFCMEGNPPIRLTFEDQLRPEAAAVARELKKDSNLKVIILSGDREGAVSKVAVEVGIKDYKFLMRPRDKYDFIMELQKQNHKVLMVGDGLNDSPALKLADASLSPASALAIAQTQADIVFQQDLWSIPQILHIAKRSIKIVKQNFVIAFLYNIVTIPLAMSGLVTPIIAAIAMSTSSILVILNAMRLNFHNEFKNGPTL